ncbi:MAG: hypothetical protein ACJ77D_10045 [Chloroflexota bacterium]
MKANDSLERGIADVYHAEAPQRAPDWVLASALETIESTPQRRVLIRAPWRPIDMSTFAKVAIAAVVVLAVGVIGVSMLGPRSSSVGGGQPTASPSPSASASPSTRATPSGSPASSPPPPSATFTSTMHGISTGYPEAWKTSAATQPWPGTGLSFTSPDIDYMYDTELTHDLFLAMASQPLAGKTGEQWVTDFLADPESDCASGTSTPITVDGATGQLCGTLVAVSAGGRGYFVRLYTSSDRTSLVDVYGDDYFTSILATVRLHPEDARDTPAAPSASSS